MFRRAVIRLTIKNTVLILSLAWLVSLGVYIYMDRTFGGNYIQGVTEQYQAGNNQTSGNDRVAGASDAVEAGLAKLRLGLIIIDGSLVILVPLVGYFLASSTLKPVQESYERQQQFIDDASHELRTPLTVLLGELELVDREQATKPELRQAVQRGLTEGRHLSALVDQLLLLAQGRGESIKHYFTNVPVASVIKYGSELVTSQSTDAQVNIQISNTHTRNVRGSESLLVQMVVNLLSNAIKASPPGSVITVSTLISASAIKIIVTDQGSGLPPEALKRAADRFWQQDQSRHTVGHGLGLAIVQQIVDLHGGTFSLIPNESQGLKAIVMLPTHSSS